MTFILWTLEKPWWLLVALAMGVYFPGRRWFED